MGSFMVLNQDRKRGTRTMPSPKYLTKEYLLSQAKDTAKRYHELAREIDKAIRRYERLSKDADRQSGNDTVTGYFNQGRRAAYDRVILDLMQWNENIVKNGDGRK